jgi:hypothetical protein
MKNQLPSLTIPKSVDYSFILKPVLVKRKVRRKTEEGEVYLADEQNFFVLVKDKRYKKKPTQIKFKINGGYITGLFELEEIKNNIKHEALHFEQKKG